MSWPILISGFMLGLTGSLHCVGMCGPLSLALPTAHLSAGGRWFSLLLYQLGRILVYSLIGGVLGFAGSRFFLASYQQTLSIVLGGLMIGFALLYFRGRGSFQPAFLQQVFLPVQRLLIGALRSANGPLGFFYVGMLNGLLPCGMVYLALAASLALQSPFAGMGFMAAFGAGTAPAMLLVAAAGTALSQRLRVSFKKIIPVTLVLAGALLVIRGLNLGIPFLSPVLPQAAGAALECHP